MLRRGLRPLATFATMLVHTLRSMPPRALATSLALVLAIPIAYAVARFFSGRQARAGTGFSG
jgi:ABC-type spermidine/putrescine transport system permease subunit I